MIQYYKRLLLYLFEKIQILNKHPEANTELCFELQVRLIQRITYVERQIRKLRQHIAGNKRHLKTRWPTLLSKMQASEIKEEINYSHYLIDKYQELLVIFRHIGDAIAFTYINKWDIKPLAFKQSPGFLSGKKGTRLERKILRLVFKIGKVAILNDLTTCLRYGDLTIPHQEHFLIVEAKSSKNKNARVERQLGDLNKI